MEKEDYNRISKLSSRRMPTTISDLNSMGCSSAKSVIVSYAVDRKSSFESIPAIIITSSIIGMWSGTTKFISIISSLIISGAEKYIAKTIMYKKISSIFGVLPLKRGL